VPLFWLALLALYVLSFRLGWFPGSGRLDPGAIQPEKVTGMFTIDALLARDFATFKSALGHVLLPSMVLASFTIGLLTRFTRSSVLEVLSNDYVRAAHAKGLPMRVVVTRHVLRAALVPVITVIGTAFASLLAGTVLVEQIFSWPGIGSYAYRAATTLDLPAIMGVSLFVAVVYITINLIVDLLYSVIDPRIRAS
jgi:peptide/nickel transport system permease protein